MILKGSQRAGATTLAHHLLNVDENEHVHVHELRGFVSDTLLGAFNEIYAISQGTQCRQFMFSVILNPPENENAPIEYFEAVRDRIESEFGLIGQNRVMVFHEKKGRRHAHCVWSRIDGDQMKAINLPHFKLRLRSISREIFIQYGWEIPRGLQNADERDPLNYTQVEHSQTKRSNQDVKHLKEVFQSCWASSDTQSAFAHALLEHGLYLARGDRRGHVAVDADGEVYSISRWVGIKAKEVRAKLGTGDDLPSVEETKQKIAESAFTDTIKQRAELDTLFQKQTELLESKRLALVAVHREAREFLKTKHETRQIGETKAQADKLPTGLKAVWFRLSGQYPALIEAGEIEARNSLARDRDELQKLIESQLQERQVLESEFRDLRQAHIAAVSQLYRNNDFIHADNANFLNPAGADYDPDQPLHLPDESQTLFTAQQVRKRPERILQIITDKEETFSRNDIVRGLANYVTDPLHLSAAADEVLRSDELIKIEGGAKPLYTTKELRDLTSSMLDKARAMASQKSFGVSSANIRKALRNQNAELRKQYDARLSDEQTKAIKHILGNRHMSNVVGLAGSGKSTMLCAANEAWTQQGYRVRGVALSGKAADGLQESSGIESRTLASLELSWKNGFSLLEPNDVLVIDEAGMIGTRQLQRFVNEADRCGAKLVLVGDPEQLQPINAGNPFREIKNNIEHAELTEIRRQKDEWQRQASLDFAQDRSEAALETYADHGAVETSANTSEAIAKLVQDYMIDLELRGSECSRLALAYRRKDVHAINQGIRMARKSGGELTDEKLFKTRHGPRAFADGDRILFTMNDHELGVRNGLQGVVESVTDSKITVRFDSDGQEFPRHLTFSPKHYNAIDHGYGTTIHKSQGTTVDYTFVLGSRQMDHHLTYVAMSRHRDCVRLYSDDSSPLNLGQKMKLRPTRRRNVRRSLD